MSLSKHYIPCPSTWPPFISTHRLTRFSISRTALRIIGAWWRRASNSSMILCRRVAMSGGGVINTLLLMWSGHRDLRIWLVVTFFFGVISRAKCLLPLHLTLQHSDKESLMSLMLYATRPQWFAGLCVRWRNELISVWKGMGAMLRGMGCHV